MDADLIDLERRGIGARGGGSRRSKQGLVLDRVRSSWRRLLAHGAARRLPTRGCPLPGSYRKGSRGVVLPDRTTCMILHPHGDSLSRNICKLM